MPLLLPELSDADMKDVAAILTDRGYPGGTHELADEAREWFDIDEMTDAQALSGVGRKFPGGLEAFISLRAATCAAAER